ncbi:L-threonine 3-dehydrogenase [Alkalicoccus luteus]|uniref:L-threonine 3-dehydrogenase n=1 Tax=Alkalicoccus luteus TaxID=1237094 RepID=A0A969PNY6_9BACI|nr:L-threonine 3-dehydrogenase [Alkalicoccus luteus]NJP36284.1 L-threonine 3-dehydrogenase [Alkalicoccus luteus]
MNRTMKAVVKQDRARGAVLKEVPVPTCGAQEVLIKVKATSICGTDVHIYEWDEWSASRVKPPYVFGHEFSGEVVETGSLVKSVKVGDQVSAETHIVCGRCPQCMSGNAHICEKTEIIGVDRDGCFAEYVVLPEENIWQNEKSLPWDEASIQEPMGNAVHTVLAGETAGRTAAIIGCGPIGLMACAVAKAAGAAEVFAIDLNPYRLELAQSQGADYIVNPLENDPVQYIREKTGGRGVDIVCEMSGHPVAMNQGFKMATNGGRISILSLPVRPVEIDITNDIVFKGLTVQGITGRKMFQTWQQTAGLLRSDKMDAASIITHRFPLEDFEKGFDLMLDGKCGKVVLHP